MMLLAFAVTVPLWVAAPAAVYFDDAGSCTNDPAFGYLQVVSVPDGYPAREAGIRAGDKLIGVDGSRVRDVREAEAVRLYFSSQTNLTINIMRAGRPIKVVIPNPMPVRRAGLMRKDCPIPFASELARLGVDLDRLPGLRAAEFRVSESGSGPARTQGEYGMNVARTAGLPEHALAYPFQQPYAAFAAFPARAQDRVLAVLSKGDPTVREWVSELLSIHLDLAARRYREAADRVARGRLSDRAVDPFLDSLLRFYVALMRDPPGAGDKPLSAAAYGVEPLFFAMCYPYPSMQVRPSPGPAFDPDFQSNYVKATSGKYRHAGSMSAAATLMVSGDGSEEEVDGQSRNRKPSDNLTFYIKCVRAALLDPERQGGWPYRIDILQDEGERARIFNKLVKRLEEKPDQRIETSFAILSPAFADGKVEAFSNACEVLYAAGGREWADAVNIVRGGTVFWKCPDNPLLGVMHAVGSRDAMDPVYVKLARGCPALDRRLRQGRLCRRQHHIEDPAMFCAAHAAAVAFALDHPVDRDAAVARYQEAMTSSDRAVTESAFRSLVDCFRECADSDMSQRLLSLRSKVDPGVFVDGFIAALGLCPPDSCVFGEEDIQTLISYFDDIEEQSYDTVWEELKKIKPGDASIGMTAAELHRRYGVPSVCALLAARLRADGDAGSARMYERKCIDTYETMKIYIRTERLTHRLYRDLAPMPELKEMANRYRIEVAKCEWDSGYTTMALQDAALGRVDSCVENLVRAVGKTWRKQQESFLYSGRFFPSASSLHQKIIRELAQGKQLTEKHVAALNATGAAHIIGALNKLK